MASRWSSTIASTSAIRSSCRLWHLDPGDAVNQDWGFERDAVVAGYFNIKSEVSNVGNSLIGVPVEWQASSHVVSANEMAPNDFFRWRFIQDPAGSGYCYLQNRAVSLVLAVQAATASAGAKLVLENPVGDDRQLWKSAFPATADVPSALTWQNPGSGSGTIFSGSQECSYSSSLQIRQDGTFCFAGQYTNRGDTLLTAPGQSFGVAMVVHDLGGNWYGFAYGGYVNSAPQNGDTMAWDQDLGPGGPGSSALKDNWISIALAARETHAVINVPGDGSDPVVEAQIQAAVTAAGGGSTTSATMISSGYLLY